LADLAENFGQELATLIKADKLTNSDKEGSKKKVNFGTAPPSPQDYKSLTACSTVTTAYLPAYLITLSAIH
jgi:hypothetical protein